MGPELFCMERVAGRGEDQACCGVVEGPSRLSWAAVFDGLGGLGARRVVAPGWQDGEPASPASEARVAALTARNALERFVAEQGERWAAELAGATSECVLAEAARGMVGELERAFDQAFLVAYNSCAQGVLHTMRTGDPLGCDLPETLPTNMALVMGVSCEAGTFGLSIWAGDARCLMLDEGRLRQLSVDDNATGDDAMDDLLHEAPLPQTNRLGYDKALAHTTLALNVTRVEGPAVLLAMSDGCYGAKRLASPMHLESLLRTRLSQAPTLEEGMAALGRFYAHHGEDDCSMAALPVNVDDAEGLRLLAGSGLEELNRTYLAHYPAAPALPQVNDAGLDLGSALDASAAFRASAAGWLRDVVAAPLEECPAEFADLWRAVEALGSAARELEEGRVAQSSLQGEARALLEELCPRRKGVFVANGGRADLAMRLLATYRTHGVTNAATGSCRDFFGDLYRAAQRTRTFVPGAERRAVDDFLALLDVAARAIDAAYKCLYQAYPELEPRTLSAGELDGIAGAIAQGTRLDTLVPCAGREEWPTRAQLDGLSEEAARIAARLTELEMTAGPEAVARATQALVDEKAATDRLGVWYAFLDERPFATGDVALDERVTAFDELRERRRTMEASWPERMEAYRAACRDAWAPYKPEYELYQRRL